MLAAYNKQLTTRGEKLSKGDPAALAFDALIAAVAALAAQRGLARIRYTTQLNNLAAQRAAQRCGLRSSGAQVTYHCRLEMPAAMEEML